MNTAVLAEPVLRDFRIEPVQGKRIAAGQKPESLWSHSMMQHALFGADRAIACDHYFEVSLDFKFYLPAMAASPVGFHASLPPKVIDAINVPKHPEFATPAL
ncbi:MAG TPA: hypothetical protein PKY50_18770 [Candidatus Competibacter sp.]|nr:hypothetical protein [Candidatus Competibacter sp.]